MEGASNVARAKRGSHLPVVLTVPETADLLGAMHGVTWLMAALIYGGGLRSPLDNLQARPAAK